MEKPRAVQRAEAEQGEAQSRALTGLQGRGDNLGLASLNSTGGLWGSARPWVI